MASDPTGNSERSVTTEELMAAAGYKITNEGKARARAKLDEARARRTPERKAAFRRQIRGDSAEAA